MFCIRCGERSKNEVCKVCIEDEEREELERIADLEAAEFDYEYGDYDDLDEVDFDEYIRDAELYDMGYSREDGYY